MFVVPVINATRMPTDGFGASAAERENGNATVFGANTVTCSGGAAAAIAGDIILLATGYWAEVTGPAVATVLPVKEWKKYGIAPHMTNTGAIHPLPPANTTYRIFPSSVLQGYRFGHRVKRCSFMGVAGATLTINGPTNAAAMTIPVGVAGPAVLDFGEEAIVQGPFTVVQSNHAILAQIEFEPVGA